MDIMDYVRKEDDLLLVYNGITIELMEFEQE